MILKNSSSIENKRIKLRLVNSNEFIYNGKRLYENRESLH